MMDKIILGADAILPGGWAINKIGSFAIGSAAYQEGVPLYIASTLLKFHPKTWIKIEERSPEELWKGAPKKLKIINFAFDVIPPEFITGIICEAGIIDPKKVKKIVQKVHPFI